MAILTVGAGRQYTTIGAAIDASQDGDTIQVQAGTYQGLAKGCFLSTIP